MSKTIHIGGAGSPAGIGMTRCLREHYELQGHDKSPWGEIMMECTHETKARVGNMYNCDMILPVADGLVEKHLACDISFMPPKEQFYLCKDKLKTADALGDLAPKRYWGRDKVGAGGKGAELVQEYLPGNNYSCEFVFKDGTELARFQKKRISYSVKERTEGIDNRGSSAVSICTNYLEAFDQAHAALNRIAEVTDTPLHGFYGVDLKCDADGVPKVTEINAGRLLTASYSFFHLTGYNLPLIGVQAFLGDSGAVLPSYPEGYGIIRQTDQLPTLCTPDVTNLW